MSVLGFGGGCGLCCWDLVWHGGGVNERVAEEDLGRMQEREQKRGAEEREELIEAILLCVWDNGDARPWVPGSDWDSDAVGRLVPRATTHRRRLGPEFSSHSHTDLHSTTGTTPLNDTRRIGTYQHLIALASVVKNDRRHRPPHRPLRPPLPPWKRQSRSSMIITFSHPTARWMDAEPMSLIRPREPHHLGRRHAMTISNQWSSHAFPPFCL